MPPKYGAGILKSLFLTTGANYKYGTYYAHMPKQTVKVEQKTLNDNAKLFPRYWWYFFLGYGKHIRWFWW